MQSEAQFRHCIERLVTRHIVFLLFHLEPFLSDFALQTHQLAIDALTLFKVVDEQNPIQASQNIEAITLDASHRLQSIRLTTSLTPEHCDGSRFRSLSRTGAKNPVCFNDTLSFLIRHPL